MTIRPIKNGSDHESALKRIQALMSAEAGTEEGDELDVLATLVDAYEAKHFPIETSGLVIEDDKGAAPGAGYFSGGTYRQRDLID